MTNYNYNDYAYNNMGGFDPTPMNQGFGSPAITASPSENITKKGRPGVNQSLTPVTVKQLLSATQAQDETFKIDNRDVNLITAVGLIEQVSQSTTSISFIIDDSTGKMEAKFWISDQQDQQPIPEALRQGNYVRIVGHLRSFHGKRSLMAFRILPIKDFNEVTYHLLEALYVHLYNTRGPATGSSNTWNAMSTVQNGTTYASNQYSNNYYAPQWGNNNDNSLATAVLQAITSNRNEKGVHISTLCQQLGKPEAEIRSAIDFLMQEGHIFSTFEDDRYSAISFPAQ